MHQVHCVPVGPWCYQMQWHERVFFYNVLVAPTSSSSSSLSPVSASFTAVRDDDVFCLFPHFFAVGSDAGRFFPPPRYFLPVMILDSCLAHDFELFADILCHTSIHVLVLKLQVYSCSQQACSSVFWFPLHCCHFFSWENMILQHLQVFFSHSLRFGLLYRIQILCQNVDLNEGWCTGFQDKTECFWGWQSYRGLTGSPPGWLLCDHAALCMIHCINDHHLDFMGSFLLVACPSEISILLVHSNSSSYVVTSQMDPNAAVNICSFCHTPMPLQPVCLLQPMGANAS